VIVRAKRFAALVAAMAATGVSALSLASNAQAAPCDTRAGVTIVVQYGDPAGTSVGCATGDPTTGLEALKTSGHRYTFVPRQPGFVCTIDARPDPCNNGPANAYWSYWHAQPGGSWSYGSLGAGSYDPLSGSVEGWAFGSGKPPRSRPPVAGTSGNATPGSLASGTGATGSATAADGRTSASAHGNLPPNGRGGLAGLVGGVGLVVLLGALAGYLARRRSHAGTVSAEDLDAP
jgi:hypothetical protein